MSLLKTFSAFHPHTLRLAIKRENGTGSPQKGNNTIKLKRRKAELYLLYFPANQGDDMQ